MKQGWEIKRLEDEVEFQRGLTYSKKDEVDFSDNIVLRSNNVDLIKNELDFTELKYINPAIEIQESKKVKKGSLLICTANGSKSHLGKVALIDDDYNYAFGGFMGQITPKQKLDSKFLFYLMTSDKYKKFINELSDGANINNLKFSDLGQFEIALPPLPEQQRIVSILDEAFAAIAKAKANAEQNLKNAKELFKSYLQGVFENGDWETKTIQEITKVVNGYAFASKDFKPTNTIKSVKITNVGVKEFVEEADNYLPEKFKETLNDFQVREGNIVIALTRTIISAGLKVAVVPASYDGALVNQRVAALVPNEKLANQNFLYYFLTTSGVAKYVLAHVNTLMQPNLSINDLKNLPVPFPPLKEQQTIVRQLDALRTETQKLEAVYQKKIADLEELKKSILQKAFAGELSSTSSSTITKIIPLQKVEGISPTDLQAGITAIALQSHSELNKQDAFGHVKAEKIVHLAEYVLNVDLERNPVKGAAGPNDFPHAMKVESRAAKAGFYTVAKRATDQETGYVYTQGRSIGSLIQKTQNSLGERNELMSQLLQLIVPMKTQQAEIVATVYAAWNNLILKGDEFSDEDIVTEARENWREEKLKIPREKFFNAIEWMRKNELLIPKGNGKIVKGK